MMRSYRIVFVTALLYNYSMNNKGVVYQEIKGIHFNNIKFVEMRSYRQY